MEIRPFNQDLLQSLSPVGRALFNKFGRGETRDYPFKCVHQAFEFQARSHPEYLAAEDLHEKITYSQLDRRANCLAAHLREMGIYPGSRVGLLVERSIHMVVGILAILKAGGAYVPLDGNVVSSSTLTHALRDSDASLVLVQDKFAERVFMTPTVSLDEFSCSHISRIECSKPEELSSPDDSAYIIYTSGTNGVPKGVNVMHRNVTNLVCVTPGNLAMSPGLRVSQLMNISFDMAAWEILGSLCNGSTLCLRGKTSKEWRSVMKSVDIVIATPSMLVPHDPADYPNIKVTAVGGEPCPKLLADAWAKSVDFYNCCGPTEVTIVHTMHRHSASDTLGIGGPTPNNTVYILDEQMKPTKIGDVGIMWAGGAGITNGYLNLPGKTTEVYKPDPFLNDGSMMFNTGDLARWRSDGNLEHLGRVDDQVKVKGFRVELDGVAAAMETTPGVKLAAAVLLDGDLWGFYMPPSVGIDAVRASTSRIQPYYGVPTRFIPLATFPVTMNGKIDKAALKQLALESALCVPHSPPLNLLTPDNPAPKLAQIKPLVIEKRLTASSIESDDDGTDMGQSMINRPPSEIPSLSPPTPPAIPRKSKHRSRSISPEQCSDHHLNASSLSATQNMSVYSAQLPSPASCVPRVAEPVRYHDQVFAPSDPRARWNRSQILTPLTEMDEDHEKPSPSVYSPAIAIRDRPPSRQSFESDSTSSTISVERLAGQVSRRTTPRSIVPLPPIPAGLNMRIPSRPPVTSSFAFLYETSHNSEKLIYNGGRFPDHIEVSLDLPINKDIGPSALEDQTSIWAEYKQDVMPEKSRRRFWSNIWHWITSICRRLFGLVILLNLIALIGVASKGENALMVSDVVVGNLFLAIIMRQDYVVNAIYLVFTAIPTTWPLWIRKTAAGIHHIEGIHSGAGASSLLWQLYYTVQATREMISRREPSPSNVTLSITYVVLLLLLILLFLAYPGMHKKVYSSFEASHRLLGWGLVILVCVQAVLVTNDYRPPSKSLGMALVMSSSFWLVFLMLVSLVLSCLRLRKVDIVYCERLSPQAIRIYLDHSEASLPSIATQPDRHVVVTPPAGSLVRISDGPLSEWHNFATLPEPGKPGFSIIVNRGNEWVKQQIAHPPTKIWIRGPPIYGLIRIAPMFRRIVIVATSSGIGHCIPIVLEQKIPIRLLWISSNIRETFGNNLVDSVLKTNPQAILYNTQQHGKPDMVKLTYRLVKEFDAEAVLVMSNKKVTEKVVSEMMNRGIPAFGAT